MLLVAQVALCTSPLHLIDACCVAVVQEHAASGCPGQLSFQIEDIFGSGDSLTCSCAICSGLSIVV